MIDKELRVFRRINEAISFAPDVEAVAGYILDIVIEETVAENASIMMPSYDKTLLEIKAAKGFQDSNTRYSERSLGNTFPMGEGIAGTVAFSKEPIIINDTSTEPLYQNKKNNVEIGSMLSLPIIYGRGELVGVLNLSHSRPNVFTRDDLNLVNRLLPGAALALRNARVMRDVEEINTMLKAELSMTDKALNEFGKNIFRVFTCMSIGVLTTDPKGVITTINKKASDMLKLNTGQSVSPLVGEKVLNALASDTNELSMDVEIKGRILNLELSALPMKPSMQVLMCVRDVSIDRFKEKELVRIKDQYKDMVEKAIDAVYIIKSGRFLLINRKFQEMLGYDNEEIINKHFRHFVTRESVKRLANALRPQGGNIFVPNLEMEAMKKDGQRLFLEISIGRLIIENEQCYVGVVRDITSKKELLALKTRFLHVASHEIRVPLTVIRGYARMLSKNTEQTLTESQQESIYEIETQCEKLLHFSNSLLDFAKINTEKNSLHKQHVNSCDYISGIVRNMQISAQEKNVRIIFEDNGHIPQIYVDPIKFEQAICNLLDNAVKHSPDGGEVRITVSSGVFESDSLDKMLNKESVMISFIDQGPGIRPEEARELFSDFFVGINGRAKGGIGLGLAITREIIHAHGGHVEARSSDGGGHFVITIPLNS
ncbi:MAG TPA: PAS domain S-box protein [Deltaproteobacteria bacterium]|nr:PAS domain S-box protein [Deltaproteobacteria bacterium]